MSDPFEVLGVPSDSDPAAIRQRYLQLVREHPPERQPERFAEIRAAYDQLQDPVVFLERRLFDLSSSQTFDSLIAQSRRSLRDHRLPTSTLLSLARS